MAMIIFSLPFLSFAKSIGYPSPQGFFTDITGTLNQNQKNQLEQDLSNFKKETGNEIAILIVGTTEPETIEQYSIHVTDEWKIGQKGLDNGILFVIAIEDHAMRIEVGRGLEGALTDIESVGILNQFVKPFFQQGKYFEGIQAGTEIIKQIAKGEFDKSTLENTSSTSEDPIGTVMSILLFIVPFILLTFCAGWMAKSKGILAGGITGAAIAAIAATVVGIGIFYIIGAAIGGGIVGLFIDKSVSGGTKGPGGTGRGGFWGGGFGGGGFGGGSSGGGFGGFGGGGFSGGGGSGRW